MAAYFDGALWACIQETQVQIPAFLLSALVTVDQSPDFFFFFEPSFPHQ